jgi:diguanylate cyclase (GGDEF)-like protein/PAS domain S-box-containing protein
MELNKAFLDERSFTAFAQTSKRRYLFLCNMDTKVSRVSPAAVDYFGLPGEYLYDMGKLWAELVHPDDKARFCRELESVLSGEKEKLDLEYRIRNKDGDYVICTGRGFILPPEDGKPALFAGTIINHGILDNVDALTDLYNIYALQDDLQELNETRENAVIMLLGLNHFRTVNDVYGYTFGNSVLKRFAVLLSDLVRGKGVVYRMDGAKFALRLDDVALAEVQSLYAAIRKTAHDLEIRGQSVTLGVSGAAARLDCAFHDPQLLLSNLENAREESKRRRFSQLVVVQCGQHETYGDAVVKYETIRSCVHQQCKGFYLCYQPLVEADTNRIIGMEALLRWHGEPYGEVMPGEFIQQLEQDECFFDLGNWILTQALTDGLPIVKAQPDFRVSVNVSYTQLDRADFRDCVDEILKKTGFPPENLYLELTERRSTTDMQNARTVLEFFRSRGVKIALDDFGTGTASMNLLRTLPINCLKIDRSFISNIQENRTDEVIVETVIQSADKLGMRVCLEGIENQQLRDYVRKFRGTTHQGYYYSKPIPIDQFHDLLERKTA